MITLGTLIIEELVEERGFRVFSDACTICQTRETNFNIFCDLRSLFQPCIRNLNIPREEKDLAMALN